MMTPEEASRALTRLQEWAEDVATYGDVDVAGNAAYVDSGTLLEEVQHQMTALAFRMADRTPPARVPLIHRAAELED